MASVHAISNIAPVLSTMQVQVTDTNQQFRHVIDKQHKWTYLLANTINFTNKPAYSIRLPKPAATELASWIEKIITGGQCKHLFVEQLCLDEVSFKRIKQLSNDYGVTLINLMHQQDLAANVIQGPW
jgi:translation initiation factor RLI1